MNSDKIKFGIACSLAGSFLIYSGILYSSLPAVDHPQSALADKGKTLWQQHNCGACHQVYGLGGFLGPDLTNVYSIREADYIKAFIQAGTKTMPAFNMSDNEMAALLSYLKDVDASGIADPRSFKISNDGFVVQ